LPQSTHFPEKIDAQTRLHPLLTAQQQHACNWPLPSDLKHDRNTKPEIKGMEITSTIPTDPPKNVIEILVHILAPQTIIATKIGTNPIQIALSRKYF
jgi:hypothetical protein